jgi:UDP-N-acetylglucosamine 2-epimerase
MFHMSLGSELFLNALHHVDVIVGNSSSGLYEAPSFGIATVNIGDRQKGRLRAPSVIDCTVEAVEIANAIKLALSFGKLQQINPYGDGHAAEKIVAVLEGIKDLPSLMRKPFYEYAGDAR